MTHVLVFLSAAAYEAVFLCWTMSASQRRPVAAAFFSVCVAALSLYGITAVVTDRWLAVALLAGYAVGSYATVRFLPQ